MEIPNDAMQVTLPPVLTQVSELVEARPEAFIMGDEEMRVATLQAAKYVFDLSVQQEQRARPPIAQLLRSSQPSKRPQTRSQTKASAKRKRSPSPPPKTDEEIWQPTPLESLHLEGMDVDQVWAQLELRTTALCEALRLVFSEDASEYDEDGIMVGSDEESLEDLEGFEGLAGQDEMDEDEDEANEDEVGDNQDGPEDDVSKEGVTELRDPSDDSEEEDQIDLDRPTRPNRIGKGALLGKRKDGHPILDDGFFSLAEFNAEIEEAEAKDVSKGRLGQGVDSDDDDEADDDVDLFSALDDVGGAFEEEDLEDEGEPYYKDFFAAPLRTKSTATKGTKRTQSHSPGKESTVRFHDEVRFKNIASRGKGLPVSIMKNGILLEQEDDDYDGLGELEAYEEEAEDEGEEAMDSEAESDEGDGEEGGSEEAEGGREIIERLKDDLFAEDEAPSKDLSNHEARQAEIAAQIAELESTNVAPKEWTLMGEASSRSRPVNSLLEEDLEFERALKAAPVITEESVNSLEEIIKKRILDNRFDDVVRKRAVDDKPFLPSRFFELNDQKSTQSLAQIYEAEYTANANGTEVDDRDGRLKKEHEELEKLWDNISYKLDALSNAHFTPKQPKATISTISNLAATTLESALPTTKSTTTMLAPEEVFAAPSELRSREELTPLEKRALRTKQRKARKKAKDQIAATVDKFARAQKGRGTAGAVKREKEKALKSVVKSGRGVTVVGKQGAELKRNGKAKAAPMDGKQLKL